MPVARVVFSECPQVVTGILPRGDKTSTLLKKTSEHDTVPLQGRGWYFHIKQQLLYFTLKRSPGPALGGLL
ncbi:hypothetical protein UVI_02057900 [Ustilaginoidea virens]|uniref:Uncharacterized protein n=1 Tax=Ustilaginoidea virens TaxID=1159556 RepID=A0A1B5L074_USTVR|nr:hypothetical protein UVI_02057900 [Ustilaginoidea virens]